MTIVSLLSAIKAPFQIAFIRGKFDFPKVSNYYTYGLNIALVQVQLTAMKFDQEAAWVHAYLHRQEWDEWNANYWYQRAGRTMPSLSLDEEWDQIARGLLGKG
jgi:hypothetical protein